MGFKALLDKLKLSSRDAVVNGEKNSLDELKRYLHIRRKAEEDLSLLIQEAYRLDLSQLILVIGNVGDGKSHLLARMWEQHPLEMNTFRVHNDATESLSKHKTYLDTLAEVLAPYADAALPTLKQGVRTVMAINLGTLTNFLDERGAGFGQLKDFVNHYRILQDEARDTEATGAGCFRFINLADYHMYTLREDGPHSQILLDIMTRITDRTDRNPFFRAYQAFYTSHPAPERCPVRYNFDLLGQAATREKVVQLLIEAIVKYKLIFSVRLAMNLVYDLLVPPAFFSLSDREMAAKVSKRGIPGIQYQDTLPWLLFNSPNTSAVLRKIGQLDPVGSSNEMLDHLIIKLGTTTDPSRYFAEYGVLTAQDRLYQELPHIPVLDRIKLFIRMNYLKEAAPSLLNPDEVYQAFMQNLYYYHAGQLPRLVTLYREVQQAIYQWNGALKGEEGFLNLDIGRQQSSYKFTQKVRLELAPVTGQGEGSGEIVKFSSTMVLGFKANGEENHYLVKIDFGLYRLLKRLNKGYRANTIDKGNHVDFKQFVSRLSRKGPNQEVIIQEFRGEPHKRFKLSFTPGFNMFQFEEI